MSSQERPLTDLELQEFIENEHYQEIMDYYGAGYEHIRADIIQGYMAQYAGSTLLDGYVVLNQAA